MGSTLPHVIGYMAIKQQITAPGHYLTFDDSRVAQPAPSWFDPEYWHQQQKVTGQAKGRGTTLFIQDKGNRWVLRHYRRGGLIGKLINDSYLFTGLRHTRSFSEFALLVKMRSLSLPVPRPVAAHVHRRGWLYRADIMTDLIPDARDIHAVLCERELDKLTWRLIGQTIARFHRHQIYHHDLNIRNLMLDGQNTVWLIDFDRCSERAGDAWKQGNLDRLYRSLNKEKGREPRFHWHPDHWQWLLEGYRATAD